MIEVATTTAQLEAMRRAHAVRGEALRDVWYWLFGSRNSR